MPLWGTFVTFPYNLLAIVHPLKHSRLVTKRRAKIAMAMVWAIGMGFNVASMVPSAGILFDGSSTVYSIWPSHFARVFNGLSTVFLELFVPLVVFVYALHKNCAGALYCCARATTDCTIVM